MRRALIVAAIILVVGFAVFHKQLIHHAVITQDSKRLVVGEKVPDFTVTDLAGKTVKLSDLQKLTESGVVSLTFWCTTCHSCRTMDARFQKLAAEMKGRATVVGIDANAADTAQKVEEFARNKKFSVPVFLDAGKAADLFGIRLTTTTVVIDKAGVLRYSGQFGGEDAPFGRECA
jgi:peroxiredoxin